MKINIQKIAYRVIPFVVALTIAFSAVVIGEPVKASAASATILDLRKMAEVSEVGGNTNYKLSLSTEYSSVLHQNTVFDEELQNTVLSHYFRLPSPSSSDKYTLTLHMPSAKELDRHYYFKCSDVPASASCRWDFYVNLVNHNDFYECEVLQYCAFSFYDKDFKFIGSFTGPTTYAGDFWDQEVSYTLPYIAFNNGRWDNMCPDNAEYFIVCFVLSFSKFQLNGLTEDYDYAYFDYAITDYSVTFGYDLANVQQDEINNAVGGMSGSAGELGAIGDQLAGVNKPDADSLNVSVDGLVPYQAMLAYTAPIKELWKNPTLFSMLTIVVTLVIVSWVFFGKKG